MSEGEIARKLTQSEREVLAILAGENVPGWTWGAAMSECLQALKGMRLADGLYRITPLGLAVRRILGEGE